jgi:hypothetical protein
MKKPRKKIDSKANRLLRENRAAWDASGFSWTSARGWIAIGILDPEVAIGIEENEGLSPRAASQAAIRLALVELRLPSRGHNKDPDVFRLSREILQQINAGEREASELQIRDEGPEIGHRDVFRAANGGHYCMYGGDY